VISLKVIREISSCSYLRKRTGTWIKLQIQAASEPARFPLGVGPRAKDDLEKIHGLTLDSTCLPFRTYPFPEFLHTSPLIIPRKRRESNQSSGPLNRLACENLQRGNMSVCMISFASLKGLTESRLIYGGETPVSGARGCLSFHARRIDGSL
jgi:hypothetical protein